MVVLSYCNFCFFFWTFFVTKIIDRILLHILDGNEGKKEKGKENAECCREKN